MSRSPIVFGALLLVAAALAPKEIAAFVDRFALEAEIETYIGSIQGLSVHAVQADAARRTLGIDGFVLRRPDLAVRIGHLSLPWPARVPRFAAPRLMQTAAAADAGIGQSGSISADDVSIDTGALHARIKHLELSGTQFSKADLAALLDAHSSVPVTTRIAKLSAAHIAIPEILIEAKPPAPQGQAQDKAAPTQGEKITLSDIGLDDVEQGRARRAKVAATSAVIESADTGQMQAALGPMQLDGLDLVQLAELLSAGASDPADHKEPLCDSLAIDGVKVTVPQTKADLGIAAVAIKTIKLRPSRTTLKSSGSSGAAPRLSGFADSSDRLDLGTVDFTDLRFSASSGTVSWSGRIGHGALSRMNAGKVSDAQFENFTVSGESATVKIGRLGWHGPTAAATQAAPATPTGAPADAEDQQKITADTLAVDLTKSPSQQGPAATPTHFQLSHFELASSAAIDGIPSRMRATLDHFTFDLTGTTAGDFAQIAALGYGRLDLSSRLNAHFDDGKRQFDLNSLSLTGIDMGAVQISGRFDQVTKGLFSPDQAVLEAALVRVLLQHLEVRIENAGLFERFIAVAAKNAGVTPAEIRKRLTETVNTLVPELLDNGRGAAQLAAALAKFIAEPKSLRLAVTAPEGIGALDAILAKDPAFLLEKVKIEAAADE